ncbi:MAG: carbamoyltransferase HypF [Desulfobacteraceae bacterium]|nr:carbamoyltransferase HypF [Desulfobacteraceae bacterium]
MPCQLSARRLHIKGIVQGVGFRPFIYKLALGCGLKGTVANDASGVIIHVEGRAEDIGAFIRGVYDRKPPLALITEITENKIKPVGFENFSILQSKPDKSRNTLISPDISICEDCLQELFDPADRRFKYPFINCTNCGPRYTIIDDIPYDRPNTSMKNFKMCRKCRAEYENPEDRRFHAQPNACHVCGPHVSLHDAAGSRLQAEDTIKDAAGLLKQGYILAIKGLGGFHLAADAENSNAVKTLRHRKLREEKPFAMMSPGLEQIRQYAILNSEEQAMLESPRRPIVLLRKSGSSPISEEVSPGNRYFGVMLPYTPLHYLLMNTGFTALVMTSGNLSEEPIVIDNSDALCRLSGIADFYLMHNRDIYLRCDDSIARHAAGAHRIIRRSRGYVPNPVFLKHTVPQILACGAELKNTVCLTKNDQAFVSQHIGDMENLRTLDFFRLTISHMKRILDIEPEAIACDMHPDYMSTKYGLEQQNIRLIPIQHHHAHIASSMAENRIDGEVIGLAFDGTGYGTDGRIWGGEILTASMASFQRAAHMSWAPMPGGNAAIKEPWRMAAAYLKHTFGNGFEKLDLPVFKNIPGSDLELISRMICRGVNSPLTSSLGRLFDAVAAIIGIRSRVRFEGQAAMELEMMAPENDMSGADIYPYELPSAGSREIPVGPIIAGVVKDSEKRISCRQISTRFHQTLINLFSDLCVRIRGQNGLNRVVLSGGVFQNVILLKGLMRMLEERGFEVYTHSLVPANDGGISLGQAAVAAEIIKYKA